MSARLAAATATDIGRLRAVNQDASAVQDGVVVVADGMGGHNGGEVASRIAIDTFLAAVRPAVPPPAEEEATTVDAVVAAVNRANEAILAAADEEPGLAGMGTTLCAVAVVATDDGERLCVVNVGDSRVYLLADGDLTQISEDHSLVAGLVRQGRLRPEDAERHPQRNILTRALGVEPRVLVDAWELEPVPGDRFLLCSDGLFTEVPDDRIAAVLRRLAAPQEAAEELVRLANEAGGRDNITVAIVDVVAEGGAAPSAGVVRLHRARPAMVERVDGPDADRVGAVPAPEPSAEPPARLVDTSSRAGRSFRASRPTWRTFAFVVVVAVVVGVGAATLAAFSGSGYYVGVDQGEVVIFEGRPGGFLWLEPSVVERSGISADALVDTDRATVDAGEKTDSLADAQALVEELRARSAEGPAASAGSAGPVGSVGGTGGPTTTSPSADPGAPPPPVADDDYNL